MHIVIKEPGNYSQQFELQEPPFEGQILNLREQDSAEPGKLFRVQMVQPPPGRLSGVFSFEVSLRAIKRTNSSLSHQKAVVLDYNT